MGHGHSHSHHDHSHSHNHFAMPAGEANNRLMRLATYAAVSMASFLLLGKFYAWWQTDSLAMLSSFTDSVFDVVMSIINMLALRYALKPADDDHRFGHSAIEDIAGLAQCVFIGVSMGLIVWQSITQLITPHAALTEPALGIGVSVIGVVFTTALVIFQTYVTRKTGSLIVAADRLHYASDILFNLGVIAAFGLSAYGGFTTADPIIAIVIAAVVLWSSRPIAFRAFDNLMDREMPDAEKERILIIVKSIPEIRGYHHLKTRHSGLKAFIQLHVDIDADLSFRDAHAIIDRLEHVIEDAFPGAEVIIHPDPV